MTGTTRRRPQGEAEPRTCGPDSARGRPPDEAGRRRVPGFLVSALSRPVATGMALAACVGGVSSGGVRLKFKEGCSFVRRDNRCYVLLVCGNCFVAFKI